MPTKRINCEVVVVGGGTAGAISAIANSRLGLDTVLVEKTQKIGGVPIQALMGSFANLFYNSKGEQMVDGLPVELLENIINIKGSPFESIEDFFSMKNGYPITVPYKPEYYENALIKMLEEEGVKVLLDTAFIESKSHNEIEYIKCRKDNEDIHLHSKVYIDATGDALVAHNSGAPTITRNSSHGSLMRIGGVDIEETLDYIFEKKPWLEDEKFIEWLENALKDVGVDEPGVNFVGKILFDPVMYDHAPMLDKNASKLTEDRIKYIKNRWEKQGVIYTLEMSLFRYLIQDAVKNGDFALNKNFGDNKGITFNGDGVGFGAWGDGVALVNVTKPYGFSSTDPEDDTKANLEAKKYNIEMFKFFKKYVPGFSNSFLVDMGSRAINRSWRHIDGYADGRNITEEPTSVFSKPIYVFGGIYEFQEGEHIPYGIIVPKKIKNLFVVGKCASGAQKCRSQISCMSMGIAAAAAAKTIIVNNASNTNIIYDDLKENLLELNVLLDKKQM